ncbi:hypothetical protein [Pseudomonas aeruginosa]|uniref:hypothetical protein n=1 Tax=Pseudomonas aeruginosa TaxID=287 RepID=UPI001FD7B4EE|nr:hypothetical protein [Pseudomonas aeruginosa]
MYEKKHIREVARKLQIDEREVLKTDFERAFLVNNGIALDTQYRMIEPIARSSAIASITTSCTASARKLIPGARNCLIP